VRCSLASLRVGGSLLSRHRDLEALVWGDQVVEVLGGVGDVDPTRLCR
jgi:hypothetical protein